MLSICLSTTVTLVFILICYTLLKNNYLIMKIEFVLNYFIFIISYCYTILINPGIPERKYYNEYIKNKNIDETKWMKCEKCNILIPRELHISHCYDCDICVKEQDHHWHNPPARSYIPDCHQDNHTAFVCRHQTHTSDDRG